ncbi:hypothetical protein WEH80_38630 [Actinomycetes bacterium KLBMP 9759]
MRNAAADRSRGRIRLSRAAGDVTPAMALLSVLAPTVVVTIRATLAPGTRSIGRV